jgi:hypothetical protein
VKARMGILVVIALMLTLLPVGVLAHTEGDPYVVDLIAGGGNVKSAMDVGNLRIWNDSGSLYVQYVIEDEDWCLTETHLQVAAELSDIPQKKGNPIPGHFEYQGEHECIEEFRYIIPLDWGVGTEVEIAAHGVVKSGMWGLADLEAALPEQAVLTVHESPGDDLDGDGYADSHFDVTISDGDFLGGDHPAWCADADGKIVFGQAYPVNVYSSYESLPAGVIEFPENLDLVNWILNQDYIGEPSPTCGGIYTWDDVQIAIWELIEDEHPGPSSLCRAYEIRDAALANGEGFVPGCGEVVGIILTSCDYQSVMIPIPVPCDRVDETVWGAEAVDEDGNLVSFGLPFSGKNWATYVEYTVQ